MILSVRMVEWNLQDTIIHLRIQGEFKWHSRCYFLLPL